MGKVEDRFCNIDDKIKSLPEVEQTFIFWILCTKFKQKYIQDLKGMEENTKENAICKIFTKRMIENLDDLEDILYYDIFKK